MATFRHFSTCSGTIVELGKPDWVPGSWKAIDEAPGSAKFGGWLLVLTLDGVDSRRVEKKVRNANLFAIGVCPICSQHHFAERVISRPAAPKNHKCDDRCLNARGRNCECSCGGKNHGAGS